jgi:hypothetical protein
MWFGSSPDDAHRFVIGLMGWMLEGLDQSERQRALDTLYEALSEHTTRNGVCFDSAAWLIQARRPPR